MIKKDKIIKILFEAIEEANEIISSEQQLEKSEKTIIFGIESKLDSLGFISLIVAAEQKIEDAFKAEISLLGKDTIISENTKLLTIKDLVDYIFRELNEQK